MSATPKTLPARSDVDPADSWDLSSLYESVEAWEEDFRLLEEKIEAIKSYRGRLGESAVALASYLAEEIVADRLLGKIYNYAGRKSDEDTTDSFHMGLRDRAMNLGSAFSEARSFVAPELMAISDETMTSLLDDEALKEYRFLLEMILRFKPYTLDEGEERILALASRMSRGPYQVFGQLDNADLKFGFIEDENGEEVEVTQGGYAAFLHKRDRDVRKRFFDTFYRGYESHKHTLAATLASGMERNLFFSRARGYDNARQAALFENNVPESVYDNLLAATHKHLESLYEYYDLRKRILQLDQVHFYDIFVPMVPAIETHHDYDEAVRLIIEGLEPLGPEYTGVLENGLLRGWVDRYENRGKRSGAYSSGCYDSDPFILMNFRSDSLDSVFTLAHEGGHSMQSYLSNKNQCPQYANYSIFVAEVASIMNETLLGEHMLASTDDPAMRAYLLTREIDDIRSTFFRQVMFAEFEHRLHERAEANKPMALDDILGLYHEILETYYGPRFTLDKALDLECLRIPHFYYNFYVFQYSTGLAAALALATKVASGEAGILDRYLAFLSGGCSKYPVDLLREAGVDMAGPEPVEAALSHFGRRVKELTTLMTELGVS